MPLHLMRSPLGDRAPHVPKEDELPATYPAGRRCAAHGCITILNHFHAGDLCYVHEAYATGHPIIEPARNGVGL